MSTHRTEILDAAAAAISGDRNVQYGPPSDNMETTAELMTSVLRRAGKLKNGVSLSARDAALCLVAVKLAREAYRHKDDNCVDGCGFFAIAAEVAPLDAPKAYVMVDPSTGKDYTSNEPMGQNVSSDDPITVAHV